MYLFEQEHAPAANMTRAEPQCRCGSFHLVCSNGQTIANYFKLVQSDPKYFKGHCIATAKRKRPRFSSFQIMLEGKKMYMKAICRL